MIDMDKPGASGLARTKSEQLVETIAAAFRSPPSNESGGAAESGGTLSRTKSSKRLLMAASPGRGGAAAAAKSTHIRKSRSAQMKFDLEDLTSSAALTRASSASLGMSFSFTGFTMPPDDIADSKPFSDDDIPEDLEAGMRGKPRFQMEPSLPIYLKERLESYLAIQRGP